MKVSTKGRYGLRAMVDMAINSVGDHVSIKSIAERQDVSENYLEQVFSSLRKANLVKSVKGFKGGYLLSKNPSEITVGEVVRALEGDIDIVDNNEQPNDGNNLENIISKVVWSKINQVINNTIDSITLEALAEEYRKICSRDSYIYYI